MDFNQIIGHEKIIGILKNAIKCNHIFHCYLFAGEESVGKRLVALAFAKALLCKREDVKPCNKCTSCLKFNSFNHPDFELIEPEDGSIPKKRIDDLIKSMAIAPLESKRRIIIIDQCDKMRIEAQNELLKTLEEPPLYVNMILITSNSNGLIPTILSRSQVIKFHPVESKKIVQLLMGEYNKTEEEANFIAHFTKGSVGRSIALSKSPDFFNMREDVLSIIHKVVTGDKMNIMNSVDFFVENKDSIDKIMDIILYWFRDLIIYKEIGDSNLIINKDKIQILSRQSFLNIGRINDIIEYIIKTKDYVKNNVNFQLAIEAMLLKIQEV
ncbi:MAG: DNA polymerase III subunit delta' [Tissierellia bacterium]|nr:DNA polymerase III subunit delta' [Tissierellia bacterium]